MFKDDCAFVKTQSSYKGCEDAATWVPGVFIITNCSQKMDEACQNE